MTVPPHFDSTERYAAGRNCFWWDSWTKALVTPEGRLLCPHCGGPAFLYQAPKWWNLVGKHEAKHPGYVTTMVFTRGKCFKTYEEAAQEFDRALLRGEVV